MTGWQKRIVAAVWFGVWFIAGVSHAVFAQVAIPNHIETVKAARALYAGLPPGRLRAYCIVNQVVWDLRAENLGLFYKTGENGFAERSSDVVIYKPRGETFDILGDADGKAIPQWGRTQPTGFGPIVNWRAPQDPSTVTACGTVTPPPDPITPPPATDLTPRVEALEQQVRALTERVTALENAHTEPAPCVARVVRTSRYGGHSHKVTVCTSPVSQ